MQSIIFTIDVAHPPLRPEEVEEELLHAWSEVRNSPSFRILKVIHGYGSSGKGSATKDVVRNWIFRNRNKFKQTIDGENYNLHNASTQEMRKQVKTYTDVDLGSANAGITIVWVK
jgi:hypothetical protein